MSSLSLNWATDNNPVRSPVLPPVRSQGICGACWAFATANAITAASRINSGLLLSLSPQELIDCDESNNGCSGGDPVKAFNYVAHYGLGLLTDYKYKAMDSICSRDVDLTRVFIDGFVKIRSMDQNSIQDLLLNGPIATGICGTDQAFLYYQSGIFDYSDCCIDQNHAVLIVGYGYDSATSQEYFILQNSWGTNWGENGFMRIARTDSGIPGICGFDLMPSYPVGAYIRNLDSSKTELDDNDNPKSIQSYLNNSLSNISIWLDKNWKAGMALLSIVILTLSILGLIYSVYMDYIIRRHYRRIDERMRLKYIERQRQRDNLL